MRSYVISLQIQPDIVKHPRCTRTGFLRYGNSKPHGKKVPKLDERQEYVTSVCQNWADPAANAVLYDFDQTQQALFIDCGVMVRTDPLWCFFYTL